ncbi:hypothetical protein [Profundibacter amoris]|uniref:hypothetical protein n=1 Tax=Profundibacter amoris TaxID=2171755 RepID=UPI0013C3336D|nr:hypothetical protein [Profundibacter amoris]
MLELTFDKLGSDKSHDDLGVFMNTATASSLDLRPNAAVNPPPSNIVKTMVEML